MNEFRFFNVFVFWTRSIVLILSIIVVVVSLTIYNSTSTPILNLMESEPVSDQILHDTVQDRRLIATLVAAQASIFCPLFLLMSSSTLKFNVEYIDLVSTLEICRVSIEQMCQFLMPLGLAFSWIFCITFDRKTEAVAVDLGTSITENLKYIIIIVLMMEVLGIWIVSFKYVSYLLISRDQQRSIQLVDDDTIPDKEYV